MNGALKKTIHLALTLGRLIFCLANPVSLFNFNPNQFSNCSSAKRLMHDIDEFIVSFRIDYTGLNQLNTTMFEVTFERSKEEGTTTTLYKWKGIPPSEVITQGPCIEVPLSASNLVMRCTITARCELGLGSMMLTMSHMGDVYTSNKATLPQVYALCAKGYAERQVDIYTVKIDGTEVQQEPTCSMLLLAKAKQVVEFCCRAHSPNITLEIAREGVSLTTSTSKCAKVEAVFETKPTEIDFLTHDACGVRGRLKCQFGLGTPPSAPFLEDVPQVAAIIAIGVIVLVSLIIGIVICCCKKQPAPPPPKPIVIRKKTVIPPRKSTIVQQEPKIEVVEPEPEPEPPKRRSTMSGGSSIVGSMIQQYPRRIPPNENRKESMSTFIN